MNFPGPKRLFPILSVLFLLLITSGLVQSATNLMVDPSRIEVPLGVGHPANGAIRLFNPGPEPIRLGAEIREWNLNENGEPSFSPSHDKVHSCGDWIRFNPRIFQLSPGKTQIVRYTITVPQGTAPGEYRCSIAFAVEPAKLDGGQIGIVGNVMTTVYAEVQPVKRNGEILTTAAKYDKNQGIVVQTAIKSTGTAHLRVAGSFKVLDAQAKVVAEGVYSGKVVFPGMKRTFTGNWKGQLPRGKYTVQSQFRYLPALYAINMAEYSSSQGLNAETVLNVE